MIEPTPSPSGEIPNPEAQIEPSWKPLLWLVGILAAVIGLGELLLELGVHLFEILLELLEALYLALIEAPEELLEDQIESWLKVHFPHEADRYSEIITAVGFTPFKLLLAYFLARWLWRLGHSKLVPAIEQWCKLQVMKVRLAWRLLFWPWKILIGVAVLAVLVVLI